MYKITLPINMDGSRYGLNFIKGIATTENEVLAKRLKERGVLVEQLEYVKIPQKVLSAETLQSWTKDQLIKYAKECGVNPRGTKSDIIKAIAIHGGIIEKE